MESSLNSFNHSKFIQYIQASVKTTIWATPMLTAFILAQRWLNAIKTTMITVNKSTDTLLDQEQEQMFQLMQQPFDMASLWRLLIQMRRWATTRTVLKGRGAGGERWKELHNRPRLWLLSMVQEGRSSTLWDSLTIRYIDRPIQGLHKSTGIQPKYLQDKGYDVFQAIGLG